MKYLKKIFTYLLFTISIFSLNLITTFAITKSEMAAKIQSLKTSSNLGDGKYYSPNRYYYGLQCYAFANEMADNIFGSTRYNAPNLWSNYDDMVIVYVGDVIELITSYGTHEVIVIDVNGDNITLADSNWHGDDIIHYGRIETRASLRNQLVTRWHYDANNITTLKNTFKPSGSVQNLGNTFYAQIVPKAATNLAFSATGTSNASKLTLQSKSYTDAQIWKFERQSAGYYVITNQKTGLVIDIANEGNTEGDPVYVWVNSGGLKMRWYIYNYNGGYRFVPESGKSDMLGIDISARNFAVGVQPQLWGAEDNANTAQTFLIQKLAEKVALNSTSVSIEKGKTYTLKGTITPSDTADKSLTWTSSDTGVATVKDGVVTAKAVGTTTITVKTVNGKSAKATITVTNPSLDITSVSLDHTTLTVTTGYAKDLIATINPSNTTMSTKLKWSSDNETVATVTERGLVIGRSAGKATITVETVNGKKATCLVTVEDEFIDITSVGLDKEKETIIVGQTLTLTGKVYPTYTTRDKTLTWKSSDDKIATVVNGVVTAKAVGKVTITATSINGKSATATITVVSPTTEIVSVSLNKTTASLNIGKTVSLTATINPSNTTQSKELTWTSSNTSVATVDSKGVVTAKSAGTTTITVKTSNGKTATCKITVESPITKITLDKTSATLDIGKTVTLKATISPSNTTMSKNLIWHSSNESVASVDANGKVAAKSAGTTTITAVTSNGLVATCTVKVNASNDKPADTTKPETDNKEDSTDKNNTDNNTTTNTDNTDTNKDTTKLSNDNTIKTLIIDGKEIEVSDTINYQTNNDDILLEITLNSEKATYEVIKNPFTDGINNVLVLVTAEDGTLKVYTIVVNKVIGNLSSNTSVKIKVDDEEVKFKDNEASLTVGYFKNKLKYSCITEDENAKCNIDYKDLKVGKNKVTFKVVAPDNASVTYVLNITRTATLLYILIAGGILVVASLVVIIIIVEKKKQDSKN